MPQQKKQFLFVSHRASMSGAPKVLLEIIKEFREQSDIPFKIIVYDDGPFLEQFQSLGETYVWRLNYPGIHSKWIQNSFGLLIATIIRKFTSYLRKKYILFKVRKTNLIFFNSAASTKLHKEIRSLKSKTVYYIHELETAIQTTVKKEDLPLLRDKNNFFFVVSKAVQKNLLINHKIPEKNISIAYASLAKTSQEKELYHDFIRSFRQRNGLSENSLLIGVAASNEWRKGFDLFYPLALLYFSRYPESDAVFVWKGFKDESPNAFMDRYDADKFNLGKKVILLPHGSDSIQHIACFDIHLLLSREDPYPLVVQEAAAFGIPTVSFADAGGSQEFIEEDSGFCVPYGDLIKMSAALYLLEADPQIRNEMGRAAKEKVRVRHNQKEITRNLIRELCQL